MRQSTKRLVSSVTALVLFVASTLIFFSLIRPTYENIQRARAEVLSRRMFTQNEQQVIEQVKKLIADYQSQAELQQAVAAALPMTPMLGEALAQLSGLMISNNLIAQSFSVAVPTTQNPGTSQKKTQTGLVKPIGLVSIQARMAGTYENLKNFLKRLETNIRIFDVSNFSIQPAGKSNQDLYFYEITVATYYQTK